MSPEILRKKMRPARTRELLSRVLFSIVLAIVLGWVVYAVFFAVPTERQADFDAWYATDHVPILMEETRWLGVRRFEIVDGAPENFNRMALHYLADKSALESDARRKARATPWRAKLAEEAWFKGRYLIFSRLGQRQRAGSATENRK